MQLTIEQTSGRQRINIHGAVDLETGQTRMIEVETVDAASTIRLLELIETFYPMLVPDTTPPSTPHRPHGDRHLFKRD